LLQKVTRGLVGEKVRKEIAPASVVIYLFLTKKSKNILNIHKKYL